MRNLLISGLSIMMLSCAGKQRTEAFTRVRITTLLEDSLSIRAIEIMDGSLAYAANNGVFGTIDLSTDKIRQGVREFDRMLPEFRAIAHTSTDFFMLSVASPALLFKTGDDESMTLVYRENDSLAFYDAMAFWNDREGIAIGDSMNGCLSIILTRDGGKHWVKASCDNLPEAVSGEGAFAASNTNIAVSGSKAWIATSAGRIYYSEDKGLHWRVYGTPVSHETPTQGIYSIDFANDLLGIAVGGDYTNPASNSGNKAVTRDGGKTWELVADGSEPGYKSCVRFVPGSGGREIVALGFTGISYSDDMGNHWEPLSPEPFYTLRFVNDTLAYAAGKNRIAKLVFN